MSAPQFPPQITTQHPSPGLKDNVVKLGPLPTFYLPVVLVVRTHNSCHAPFVVGHDQLARQKLFGFIGMTCRLALLQRVGIISWSPRALLLYQDLCFPASSSLLPFLRGSGIVFSRTFVLFQPFTIDLVENSHFTFSIGED